MRTYSSYIFLLLILMSLEGLAQQQNFPLNRQFGLVNQKVWNAQENNVHTSFLPINQAMVSDVSLDALSVSEKKYYGINLSAAAPKPHHFWAWRWQSFAYDNSMVVDTGNFYLTADPLFNLELGKDSEDTSNNWYSKNTRGAIVRANVGKQISFEARVYENQAFLPNYQKEYTTQAGVMPGQGRVKPFKENGVDFSSSSANLSYTPNQYLNFQLGTGKNSVGDGYRSLLLSDASFNYPFGKITGTFGAHKQFQYTKLNASLSSTTRRAEGSTSEALFQRKTMSVHYLSWLANKWFHIGLFEATMWQTEDATGTKLFRWQQLNPIIGINTVTTGFNNIDHTVVGANLKLKLPFNAVVYHQLVYDGASKYGYQIGAKYFGISNLTLQAEYNHVAPSTYTSDWRLQTYSNYNEPIAHPAGTDFKEVVGIVNYNYQRLFAQLKFNQIHAWLNRSHIFNTVYLQSIVLERVVTSYQLNVGFLVNPKNNMRLSIGINKRTDNIAHVNVPKNNTNYVYVCFSTSLRNLYHDF